MAVGATLNHVNAHVLEHKAARHKLEVVVVGHDACVELLETFALVLIALALLKDWVLDHVASLHDSEFVQLLHELALMLLNFVLLDAFGSDLDGESGALALLALDADSTAHELDYLLANAEAESSA